VVNLQVRTVTKISSNTENETGDLNISNYADDKDIIFYNDDGAGSVTEYLNHLSRFLEMCLHRRDIF